MMRDWWPDLASSDIDGQSRHRRHGWKISGSRRNLARDRDSGHRTRPEWNEADELRGSITIQARTRGGLRLRLDSDSVSALSRDHTRVVDGHLEHPWTHIQNAAVGDIGR